MSEFTVRVTAKSNRSFAIRGTIHDDGTQIGSFERKTTANFGTPPLTVQFFSEKAKRNFRIFCKTKSIEATVEAMGARS